jgi:hypothetical protein
VTAEQVIVLALLVAAFAAGWAARGNRADGDDPRHRARALADLLAEAEHALDRALLAHRVLAGLGGEALGTPFEDTRRAARRTLDDALAPLAGIEQRLDAELPRRHPLADDFSQGAAALRLLADARRHDRADVDEAAIAEVERAARFAHARFRREADAIALLDEWRTRTGTQR